MFFPFLERRRAVAVSKKFKQSVNPRAFMVLYASYVLLGKSSVSDSKGTKFAIQAGIGITSEPTASGVSTGKGADVTGPSVRFPDYAIHHKDPPIERRWTSVDEKDAARVQDHLT